MPFINQSITINNIQISQNLQQKIQAQAQMHYHLSSSPQNQPLDQVYYTIICKKDQKALKVGKMKGNNYQGTNIVGQLLNIQDNGHLFMICKLEGYNGQYEIVSCPTDYVLEEDDRDVVLGDGKMKKSQRYRFNLVEGNKYNLHQYYTIIPSHHPDCALALYDTLRVSKLDPNSVGQHFRLEIANNFTLQNSCVITNHLSRKVIDVPKASSKEGERITIYGRNNRWNQRWYFQRVGENSWLISSLVNNLCLDIAGGSRESGAKVVQWPQNGGTNQMWYLQEVQNKIYKIWSCHDQNLCLAVRKQQTQDGSYLEVTKSDNPTSYWMIQGALPKM